MIRFNIFKYKFNFSFINIGSVNKSPHLPFRPCPNSTTCPRFEP